MEFGLMKMDMIGIDISDIAHWSKGKPSARVHAL